MCGMYFWDSEQAGSFKIKSGVYGHDVIKEHVTQWIAQIYTNVITHCFIE